MDISHGTLDGEPVIFLRVPSGGPPVTLDLRGWERLTAAGVTSVIAQKGPTGESIVARTGKPQTAAARVVWGDEPPARIMFANGDRRDLRRSNLCAAPPARRERSKSERGPLPKEAPPLTDEERTRARRELIRSLYRRNWHAIRDEQIRRGCYPLAHLVLPNRGRRR